MTTQSFIKTRIYQLLLVLFLIVTAVHPVHAQFEVPEIEKVSTDRADWFNRQFADINWTGQGLNQRTDIDADSTKMLRARLQASFGAPTLTIDDLIKKESFRLGHAIQFEYRFVVNDSIPLMILDVFGPFGRGFSYVGASRYIDLMPQIKRTLNKILMEAEPAEYRDYYYSADRGEWYAVRFENGTYDVEKIDAPEGMSIENR